MAFSFQYAFSKLITIFNYNHLRVTLGVWSRWGKWKECSLTCGGGRMTRIRQCQGPGLCTGNSVDGRDCNTKKCPGMHMLGNWLCAALSTISYRRVIVILRNRVDL